MKIRTVEFEVNGRTYFLAVKGKSIVFSNDLEVIGRFGRSLQTIDESALQVLNFCHDGNTQAFDYGDQIELQSLLKSMI